MPVYQLTDKIIFPDVNEAEDGLLAVGGDLSSERLLLAYQSGIFPWYNEHEPILWWSPDPRFVLFPEKLKISKSMSKLLKEKPFEVTFNHDFEQVISSCKSTKRKNQDGTWISDEMKKAYIKLHRLGYAQSVEVWKNNKLVGGLYGVSLEIFFCGESMFSHEANASKYGFIHFVHDFMSRGGKLIDCQVHTQHLESFGAEHISRKMFLELLKGYSNI